MKVGKNYQLAEALAQIGLEKESIRGYVESTNTKENTLEWIAGTSIIYTSLALASFVSIAELTDTFNTPIVKYVVCATLNPCFTPFLITGTSLYLMDRIKKKKEKIINVARENSHYITTGEGNPRIDDLDL